MLVPEASIIPPHPDLPPELLEEYNEAASIINRSPRGAAAILRLCLQKLMVSLGESGKNINKDISSLVSKGLPTEVQQALDFVRVIGNESVHPGEIDLQDNQEIALSLFDVINFIVEEQISRKKRIGNLYKMIPERQRQHIEERDKNKSS